MRTFPILGALQHPAMASPDKRVLGPCWWCGKDARWRLRVPVNPEDPRSKWIRAERLACSAHTSRYYRHIRKHGKPPARLENVQRVLSDSEVEYGHKLMRKKPRPSYAEVARLVNDLRVRSGKNPVSYSTVYRVVCRGDGYQYPE